MNLQIVNFVNVINAFGKEKGENDKETSKAGIIKN